LKLLILHLTDIHVKQGADALALRVPVMVNAYQNLQYSYAGIIFAITGDLAYSGEDHQYAAFQGFLSALKEKTRSAFADKGISSPPIYCAAIPGNHDCDHSTIEPARNVMLDRVLSTPSSALEPSIASICLQPQERFFEWLASTENDDDWMVEPLASALDRRIAYKYSLRLDACRISFICINSAFLSRKHEKSGGLILPSDALPDSLVDSDFNVVMMHHPLAWFEPTCRRQLVRKINGLSDFLLTGHEHEPGYLHQKDHLGEETVILEGHVLHDSYDPRQSGFGALIVDLSTKCYRTHVFQLEGEIYREIAAGQAPGTWQDFPSARQRHAGRFDISASHREFIESPGITLTRRDKGELSLNDIYVFPDLKEVKLPSEKSMQTIKGEEIIDYLVDSRNVMVVGDDDSGKTSLAKMTFVDLHRRGYIPLLIDGSKCPASGIKVEAYLQSLVGEQYSPNNWEYYKQASRSAKVFIVDNFDKMPARKTRRGFMGALCEVAERVLVFAHEVVLMISHLTEPAAISDGKALFRYAKILPFGHKKRNQLISRWLMIDGVSDSDVSDFAHRLDSISKMLNNLVGKNFIPPYPVYVLSILQAAESTTPIDTRAGTYGYYYEIFIRAALSKDRSAAELNILSAYLSFIANRMFAASKREVTEAEWETLHLEYTETYGVSLNHNNVIHRLESQDIVRVREGLLSFKYKYLYYYFAANYFRDHIHDDATKQLVSKCVRSLYREDHANILLFLAHLSRDPFIIDQVRAEARRHFAHLTPANLESDVSFLNELDGEVRELCFTECDHQQQREKMLEAMDQGEDAEDFPEVEEESSDRGPLEPLVQLNAALKALQVLGQFLKSFPGSMPATVKLEIAEECRELGLRTLALVLGVVKDNRKDLLLDFATVIKQSHPEMTPDDLRDRARRTMVGLAELASLGMVRTVAFAIGAQELRQTLESLGGKSDTSAKSLIDMSLRLESSGIFSPEQIKSAARSFERNPFCLRLLRFMVYHHCLVFPVDYRKRQQVEAALKMRFVPQLSERKMVE